MARLDRISIRKLYGVHAARRDNRFHKPAIFDIDPGTLEFRYVPMCGRQRRGRCEIGRGRLASLDPKTGRVSDSMYCFQIAIVIRHGLDMNNLAVTPLFQATQRITEKSDWSQPDCDVDRDTNVKSIIRRRKVENMGADHAAITHKPERKAACIGRIRGETGWTRKRRRRTDEQDRSPADHGARVRRHRPTSTAPDLNPASQ